MSRSIHPPSFRHRSTWLLTLGLLAMVLHLLAGSGLVRASMGSGDGFVADLCTSHGVFQAAAAQTPDGGSAPTGAVHDCCKSCAAGGPLLVTTVAIAVAPAPTFTAPPPSAAFARPTPARWSAHSPRGPPALA
ncbi:DUF2946 family protein [Sulfuritalea sp.]|uniref:DUF2946 family protein n=1 Tax=Sulfuritalea sp. TaxID=2480090 RepID=UPI00286E5296|nr:DUF2946 family protein [Sulfuritalea sp.]